jgi:phage tail-like protein
MAADLLTSFYFSLAIHGAPGGSDAAFQEVAGLVKETGFEEVVCGGENRFKYRLPTQTSSPNLVLKRAVVPVDSPLIEWCQNTLDGGLSVPIQARNLKLSLLNPNGQPSMSWNFVGAWPIKWSMSDLKSQENSMLIETIELAYRFFAIDDPRNDDSAAVASLFGKD